MRNEYHYTVKTRPLERETEITLTIYSNQQTTHPRFARVPSPLRGSGAQQPAAAADGLLLSIMRQPALLRGLAAAAEGRGKVNCVDGYDTTKGFGGQGGEPFCGVVRLSLYRKNRKVFSGP